MKLVGRIACLVALGAPLAACEPAQPVQASAAAAPVPVAAPIDATSLSIEAGTLRAGSLPGTAGRDPSTEADLVPVALGAFEIERKPRGRAADRAAASAACAEDGARLCHELEWERACATAGARALGVQGREWTDGETQGTAVVVRGSAQGEPRCASRALIEPSSEPAGLAFRCCTGAEPALPYPAPAPESAAIAPLERTPEELARALASVPALCERASNFVPFTTSDADAALRRGKRSRDGITTWTFVPSMFVWRPARGEELHVVAGRANGHALLAALYPLGDGSYAHAASAILEEGDTSIAIGFRESTPGELLWTTCYGCPAEGGAIRYVPGSRPAIDFH